MRSGQRRKLYGNCTYAYFDVSFVLLNFKSSFCAKYICSIICIDIRYFVKMKRHLNIDKITSQEGIRSNKKIDSGGIKE